MSETSLEQTLKALREDYAENLPTALATIHKLWAALQEQWQVETLDEFYTRIHKIAGSAGSFGFNELSQVARELEVFLQELQRRTTSANEVERSNIEEHLKAIEQAAQVRDGSAEAIREDVPDSELVVEPIVGKLLYLVDDDTDLSNYLALQLRHTGFEVKVFNQVDYLPDAVKQRTPDVLLMDIMLAEDDLAGPRIIYHIQKHRHQPLPVVFMSARVDIKARLAAVRAGGNAYFTKPIDINALISKLVELANPLIEENQRVLIIDDTGDYAEDFTHYLHTEQIQVKTLLKPMQLVTTLDKFSPSLIMINQRLPALTGVELAKIIQQQDKYAHIPLILFSEEFDKNLEQACRQGVAQDYITTQVDARYLAAIVQHRIQKSRYCQKLFAMHLYARAHPSIKGNTRETTTDTSHRDRLTGLYKRKYLLDQIEIASKSQDTEHAPCLLYIKLDNYRDLDRIMGLTATEALVVEAARFLQTQTHSEEVLSRISDDAFVILTLNRSLNNVRALAELVRTTLENQVTEADDGEKILSTCTLGVSLCEEEYAKTPAKALQDAENACVLGQAKGGNQVYLHESAVAEKRGQQQQNYWRQSIELALKYNTFFLVFQPITNLHGETRMIYDVLLRMQNPEQGAEEIRPKSFLSFAKETGQLPAIDRWVIKEAVMKLMQEYQQQREVTLIVRISDDSLADASLTKWVMDSLRLMPFPRRQLIFDLSKRDAQEHLKNTQHFIEEVQKIGCGLVLSHMDQQASSLQLLRLLSPNFIKLDAQMVDDLSQQKQHAQSNISSLVNETHAQNKTVIAPFVENMQCLNQLWQCEIDYIAGHFVEDPERELNYDFAGGEG